MRGPCRARLCRVRPLSLDHGATCQHSSGASSGGLLSCGVAAGAPATHSMMDFMMLRVNTASDIWRLMAQTAIQVCRRVVCSTRLPSVLLSGALPHTTICCTTPSMPSQMLQPACGAIFELLSCVQPGVANVYCSIVQQSRGSASLVIADQAHSSFAGHTYRCVAAPAGACSCAPCCCPACAHATCPPAAVYGMAVMHLVGGQGCEAHLRQRRRGGLHPARRLQPGALGPPEPTRAPPRRLLLCCSAGQQGLPLSAHCLHHYPSAEGPT